MKILFPTPTKPSLLILVQLLWIFLNCINFLRMNKTFVLFLWLFYGCVLVKDIILLKVVMLFFHCLYCLITACIIFVDSPCYLEGRTCFEDNSDDEWFIVFLLYYLSRHIDDIIIQYVQILSWNYFFSLIFYLL